MIEIEGIHKRVKGPSDLGVDGPPILRDLFLQVQKGQVVLVTGSTGSGKSLLLSLLHGTAKSDSGSVKLLGHPVKRLQRGSLPLMRRVVGYVPQEIRLLENRTLLANVELGPKACGLNRSDVRLRAKSALESMGLTDLAKITAKRATTGQRRRTMLARAFASKPPILLADEPTEGLDDDHCTVLMNAISEMAREGGAALIVTRDPRLLERGWSRGWRCSELVDGAIAEHSMNDLFKREIKKVGKSSIRRKLRKKAAAIPPTPPDAKPSSTNVLHEPFVDESLKQEGWIV